MSADYGVTNAVKIVARYYGEKGEENNWITYVPSRLMWSPEGMAEAFRICREYLANPKDYPEAEDVKDSWGTFHVVSIEETEVFIPDIVWQEPEHLT